MLAPGQFIEGRSLDRELGRRRRVRQRPDLRAERRDVGADGFGEAPIGLLQALGQSFPFDERRVCLRRLAPFEFASDVILVLRPRDDLGAGALEQFSR